MRMIRNKKVSDAILMYWKLIEETKISLDRYMIYREAGRSILFKLWVIPEVHIRGLSIKKDSIKTLKVIDPDQKKWQELANLLGISGLISRTTHSGNLANQLNQANQLIAIIKQKYHLK